MVRIKLPYIFGTGNLFFDEPYLTAFDIEILDLMKFEVKFEVPFLPKKQLQLCSQ